MKPLHVSLIALLSINLMASSIPTQQLYQEANKSYNSGDYKTAYSYFETLSTNNPESAEYHFLLGRSALELKMYDEALTAFDRVIILNPSHTRTRLELARLYFETKQFEQAGHELALVLKENIPENIRDITTAFKKRIDESKNKHHFSVAFIIGGGYDSNANNNIGEKFFNIGNDFKDLLTYFGATSDQLPKGSAIKSDSHLFNTLVLNHSYDFGETGGWSLENALVGYNKVNRNFTDNNLNLFSLSASPVYTYESYRLSLPLAYDRIYLDGKGYMYNLSTSFKGTYLIDASSQFEAGYSHKRGFYDEDDEQNIKGNTVTASYKKAFGEESPLFISLSVAHSKNKEDIASTGNSYSVELSQSFRNGLKPSLSYTYNITDYKEVDSLYETKRSDSRDAYEIGLGYALQDNILINASVTYTKNHSNQNMYTYDKTTALLSAMWLF